MRVSLAGTVMLFLLRTQQRLCLEPSAGMSCSLELTGLLGNCLKLSLEVLVCFMAVFGVGVVGLTGNSGGCCDKGLWSHWMKVHGFTGPTSWLERLEHVFYLITVIIFD